jgi:predicted DCC family thiol-disulfide oxidoreductase YuxK
MHAPVPIAFYDGHCSFCTTQSLQLRDMARGRVELRDFQEPGALDAHPSLSHAECMRELKLVEPDGRVSGGAEAIVRLLRAARPVLGRLALLYYVPGLRWLADRAYRLVANRRYALFGRTAECDAGTCALHAPGEADGAARGDGRRR